MTSSKFSYQVYCLNGAVQLRIYAQEGLHQFFNDFNEVIQGLLAITTDAVSEETIVAHQLLKKGTVAEISL